jgi:hypothetical protein
MPSAWSIFQRVSLPLAFSNALTQAARADMAGVGPG